MFIQAIIYTLGQGLAFNVVLPLKMRANKTASTYNNFILKNEYIWKGNVPSNIYMTLPYIE